MVARTRRRVDPPLEQPGPQLHPDRGSYGRQQEHDIGAWPQARAGAQTKPGDGGLLIDGSADWNLAAALEDLKHREIDRVCIATIERVLDQLDRTRTLLMKEEQ